MKVKELIENLSKFDPEAEVILQKDSEGNGYSPLAGADDDAVYLEENSWSGIVFTLSSGHLEADMEKEEFEVLPKCVVLWPTN
jgi:hypothetical protein